MMKCFECDKATTIKKYKAYNYRGVSLDNIVLLNVGVEVCDACDSETPLLKNIRKIHDAIGIAIALQRAVLSGASMRFLRRSAGYKVEEWAQLLNVAEGTYSKWENGHRAITALADKLTRINYINVLKQRDPENIRLARYLDKVLNLTIVKRREFVIAIDGDEPEKEAKYLPDDSPILAKSSKSLVEAKTLRIERLVPVRIVGERPRSILFSSQDLAICG